MQLAVAAHSMGGLVAHRFLALDAEEGKRGYSTLLTTFSTPFGGVPVARLGLTLGAYGVPSWRDLTPDSVFLRALRAAALPKSVKHHAFFAYQQDGGEYDSDGVISVASQLAANAAHTHGYQTDHSDILESLEVFRGFAAVLAAFR